MSAGDVRHIHRPNANWPSLREVAQRRLSDPRAQLALERDHDIDQSYDIAYIAGISNDLRTLYVDRHFPLHNFDDAGDVSDELWLHECGEALFILIWGDHYLQAHHMITVVEHDLVVQRGVNWHGYSSSFDLYDKRDTHEKILRSPADLFLRPYVDSGDFVLLARIQATMDDQGQGHVAL